MNRFELREVDQSSGDPAMVATIGNKAIALPSFELNRSARYVITVEVGNLPPNEALTYITKAKEVIAPFLEGIPFLVVPSRDGKPTVGFYEISAGSVEVDAVTPVEQAAEPGKRLPRKKRG